MHAAPSTRFKPDSALISMSPKEIEVSRWFVLVVCRLQSFAKRC